MRALLLHRAAKPVLWVLCLAPLAWLVAGAATNTLGANPAEALIRGLGDWALRLLCLTLALTPLRVLTRTPALARFRRLLGLWAFAYAALHLLAYLAFDMGFAMAEVARDVAKRPFILVGMLAFAVLLLLAITSWRGAMRWLGGVRWQRLHRSVYAALVLALLHFYWMRLGKNDVAEVAVYATLGAALLGWRAWHWKTSLLQK